MYYVLYYDNENQVWDTVYGEDAMHQLIDKICTTHNLDPDEVIVIHEISKNQLEYID